MEQFFATLVALRQGLLVWSLASGGLIGTSVPGGDGSWRSMIVIADQCHRVWPQTGAPSGKAAKTIQ